MDKIYQIYDGRQKRNFQNFHWPNTVFVGVAWKLQNVQKGLSKFSLYSHHVKMDRLLGPTVVQDKAVMPLPCNVVIEPRKC